MPPGKQKIQVTLLTREGEGFEKKGDGIKKTGAMGFKAPQDMFKGKAKAKIIADFS